MNRSVILIIITVLVVASGLIVWNKAQTDAAMQMEKDKMMAKVVPAEGTMMQNDQQMDTGMEKPADQDNMMENNNSMDKMKDDTMMNKAGSYIEYSPENLATATNNGKAVLFFHASWCPTCKAANEAFISMASEIPAGVTILKTDYDTQTELKTKYAITYQHTFVQVDANGAELAKWNGGDIEMLKTNIK